MYILIKTYMRGTKSNAHNSGFSHVSIFNQEILDPSKYDYMLPLSSLLT